jgi:MFS family permease
MNNYLSHIKYFNKNVINIILFTFVFNIGNSIFNVIYNIYLLKIGFNEETIGKIISAGSLGIVIFSFLAIFFISKLGYKRYLIFSILLAIIFNMLRIFIVNPEYLYWISILSSGLMFSMSVSIYPLIMGAAKKESITYAFGVNFFSSWSALTIGNLLGGYLPKLFNSYRISLLTSYRLTLIIGTSLILLGLINALKLKITSSHKSQYLNLSKLIKTLKDKKDNKIIYEYLLTAFIIGLAAGLFVPFFNVILKNKFNMDSGSIGAIMALSQIITAFAGFVGPLMSEKMGRVKTVTILNLLSVPFLIIMGITNIVILFLISFLLRNTFINMGEPISSSFILSNIKDDKKIILNSMVSVAFQLGWFIQAPIAGNLMMKFGYSFVFYLAAGIYLLRIVLYYSFFKNADIAAKEILN